MGRGGQNNGNFISKPMTIAIDMVIACVSLVSSWLSTGKPWYRYKYQYIFIQKDTNSNIHTYGSQQIGFNWIKAIEPLQG